MADGIESSGTGKKSLPEHMTRLCELQDELMAGISCGITIYCVKKDGTVVPEYVSKGLGEMLGYSKEEQDPDFDRSSVWNVCPEDADMVAAKVFECASAGSSLNIIFHVLNKENKPVLIRLNASPMKDCELEDDEIGVYYAIHTMVSDETKELLREREQYHRILNSLGIAYFEWHRDGTFFATEGYGAYAMSDVPPDVIMRNEGPRDIIHPDDIPVLLDFFKQCREGLPSTSAVLRIKMKNGTFRWTEMRGFYPSDDFIYGILVDVEQDWKKQNERLQEALAASNEAGAAKTRFLSRVSHDMRTPLNAILGFSDLALEDSADISFMRDVMSKIHSSGQYLLGLINDILNFSKLERDAVELHYETVNWPKLLSDISEEFIDQAKKNGIALKCDFSKVRTELLVTDRLRMRQIYSNLLNNAIKFSKPGSAIEWKATDSSESETEASFCMSVADHGRGMSEKFMHRLFEPFQQEIDDRVAAEREGAGLGLAIVKKLVDLMGGTISVESELGRGTTFTICFKCRKPSPEELEKMRRSREAVESGTEALKGRRVLICEDNELNMDISVALLERHGIICECAWNGMLGTEMFADSAENYYDAVLMDIRMPVMDGLEAARAMRALDRADAETVPIIALTANAFDDDRRAAEEAGMDGFTAKPIDAKELCKILTRVIKDRRG